MRTFNYTPETHARHLRAWIEFKTIFLHGGWATLASFCRATHRSNRALTAWMYSNGVSVQKLKRAARDGLLKPDPQEEELTLDALETADTFVQFSPASLPSSFDPVRGVDIVFPDGVRLTFRECSPEGLLSILEKYERRGAAKEAGCSR